jgi:pSer/pThr/pTyr-binding forkhead associated (FHA) protein
MATKIDDTFDPSQPALLVTYGNTAKKHRPLTRSVVVLGRARGCDIGLVAPDVSNVHCMIIRSPEGFQIRDCSSRSGTRLNGTPITEALLHDGDTLQIGPFSFQVYLPAGVLAPRPSAAPPDLIQRLQRSRQKLARLALARRRRLREHLAARPRGPSTGDLAERQAELNRQAATVREQQREMEQRSRQLEKAERDIICDRETLDKEFAALQERVQKTDQELTRRQQEVEADIRARWESFQQRMRQEDEQLRAKQPELPPPSQKTAEDLDKRHQELEHWARHLQKNYQRLTEREAAVHQAKVELAEERRQVQLAQTQLTEGRAQWDAEQAQTEARLAQQQQSNEQADATLRQKRAELVQMVTELKHMQEAARRQENADLLALREENERLQQLLAEVKAERPGEGAATAAVNENLVAERAALHQEVERLSFQLTEKDALIAQLGQLPAVPTPAAFGGEIESYEAELDGFRLRMEAERQALCEQARQLRAQSAELHEASRALELERSRERAEFARERVRLARLRDEALPEGERPLYGCDPRQRPSALAPPRGDWPGGRRGGEAPAAVATTLLEDSGKTDPQPGVPGNLEETLHD